MDIGLAAPIRGPMARKPELKAIAERSEALGFKHLCVPDHIIIPRSFAANYPYAADGRPTFPDAWLEQLTAMAWLAAVTESVRLITAQHRAPRGRSATFAASSAPVACCFGHHPSEPLPLHD